MTEENPNDTTTKQNHLEAQVSKKEVQDIFRMLFASDNSLIELFHRDVVVKINDLADLNRKLSEKLSRNNVQSIWHRSLVRFEDGQAREYNSWEKFIDDDWNISKVVDSLSLTWSFMLVDKDGGPKPHIHKLNILITSSIKPYSIMQFIFSKNIEDVDRLELMAMPITCRIDFQDHIISQEILSLVSEWNKSLDEPHYAFPIIRLLKKYSRRISSLIRNLTPIVIAFVLYAYYASISSSIGYEIPLTTGFIVLTVQWLFMSVAFIFISFKIGVFLAEIVERNLHKYGKFQVLQITNGDSKKQSDLMAKSSATLTKVAISSLSALLINIIGTVVACFILSK